MDLYNQAITNIIKDQQAIIGPLAIEQARKVAEIQINDSGEVKITRDPKQALIHLVEQYQHLFGQASVEVCKDAVREVKPAVPTEDLPEILR